MKLADLKTTLLPHQERVRDKMLEEGRPGLVVAHGLGTGKTLTSIAAHDALDAPATVLVPAALKANYVKEQAKHTEGTPPPATLETIQAAATRRKATPNPLLIVDEAHKLRDPSTAAFKAVAASDAEKKLLLTASPFYNHPADLSALVNLASRTRTLPTDRDEFERLYYKRTQVQPSRWQRLQGATPGEEVSLNEDRRDELRKTYGQWVDYHEGSREHFPDVERKTVKVQLDPQQREIYDAVLGKAPSWVSSKVKAGLPPSKQELAGLATFLNGPRQISVSTAEYTKDPSQVRSPKIDQAFTNLQAMLNSSPRAKAVVYSNYIGSGISPYKSRLEAAGIPHGEFTGALSPKERDAMVRDYNEGKLRALLLSSAGGEGLDLKGTRLVQLLDPHWNQEKLKQVEGRAARYKSHADLPKEEQKVLVEQYLAQVEPEEREGWRRFLLGKAKKNRTLSADEYLYTMSQNKERLLDEFRGLLKPEEKKAAVSEEAAAALKEKLKDGHWTASTNSDGYPKVKIDGESRLATHVLLEMKGRPVKPGQVVMHRDNNLRNLNLDNLRVGTQQQNLKQMRDEGRDRPRGVDQEPDVKTAAPSWVKQIRATLGSGDLSGAQGIASRMNAAKTRLVKPLSIGGQEAAVGLTAGTSLAGPTPTGLQVRKFYKPDSFVANRDAMTKVLEHKQDAITAARDLGPEARALVPDMYGSKALHGGAKTRHISDHEYVPGLRPMQPEEMRGHAASLDAHVLRPLEMSGRPLGDVPRPDYHTPDGVAGNVSNLMVDGVGKPRMVDFLPHGRGTPLRLSPRGAVVTPDTHASHTAFSQMERGKPVPVSPLAATERAPSGTAATLGASEVPRDARGWGDLMREVHRPQEFFPATTHFPSDSSWGKSLVLPPQLTMPAAKPSTHSATPVAHPATQVATQVAPKVASFRVRLSLAKLAERVELMSPRPFKPEYADAAWNWQPPAPEPVSPGLGKSIVRSEAGRLKAVGSFGQAPLETQALAARVARSHGMSPDMTYHMAAHSVPANQTVDQFLQQQAKAIAPKPIARPAPLPDHVAELPRPAPRPAPAPAPAPAPMPSVPTTSAQVVGVPRPRPGLMPSAAPVDSRLLRTTPATGIPAMRPPVPAAPMPQLPTVPRPKMPSMPRLGAMLHK